MDCLLLLVLCLHGMAQSNSESLYQKGMQAYKKNDFSTSIDYLRQAAEEGYTKAQEQLGYLRSLKLGNIPPNYQEAIKWLGKAIEKNSTRAMCELAFMYGSGHGVEKSKEKQIEWYRKAADLGNPFPKSVAFRPFCILGRFTVTVDP